MQTLDIKSEVLQIKNLKDIVYLEAIGEFTNVYRTNGQKELIHEKINDLIKLLPSDKFFQIHDLFIINADFLKRLKGDLTKYVLLKDDLEVIISPKRYELLLDFLKNRYTIA